MNIPMRSEQKKAGFYRADVGSASFFLETVRSWDWNHRRVLSSMFQWIGLREKINRKTPWLSWENLWSPVKIFPSTNPINVLISGPNYTKNSISMLFQYNPIPLILSTPIFLVPSIFRTKKSVVKGVWLQAYLPSPWEYGFVWWVASESIW